MKKLLPYTFIILFPYFILFLIYSLFQPSLMERFFENNFYRGLLFLCIFGLLAFVSAVTLLVNGLARKKDALELARVNMVIKLVQIPAYLLIFAVGLLCMITIFTFGISLILMVLDGASILFSGLVGICAVTRGHAEGILSPGEWILHSILQFVFCADLVSAVIVYRKAKRKNASRNSLTFPS